MIDAVVIGLHRRRCRPACHKTVMLDYTGGICQLKKPSMVLPVSGEWFDFDK
jgi:hypothetical protein